MTAVEDKVKRLLSILHESWSIESSTLWTPENPAKGQCGVTSLVVQDWLGGDIYKTRYNGAWHYYNVIKGDGYDLTESQFPTTIDYEDIPSNREDAFSDTNEQQYEYLKNKVASLIKQHS